MNTLLEFAVVSLSLSVALFVSQFVVKPIIIRDNQIGTQETMEMVKKR